MQKYISSINSVADILYAKAQYLVLLEDIFTQIDDKRKVKFLLCITILNSTELIVLILSVEERSS